MPKKNSKQKGIMLRDMSLSDINNNFPEVSEFLANEVGLHCMNCILAKYETLEEGALVHGIKGDEFEELLEQLNNIIKGK